MCYNACVTYEALVEEVMSLPADQRAALHKKLSEALAPEVEAAWATEVSRRIEDIRSGKAKTSPADVALAEIRQSLKK